MKLTCKACGASKDEADFYVSRRTACKECVKALVLRNRYENIEYYRAYDRERGFLPHRVEATNARAWRYKDKPYKKDWAKRNPEKTRANACVGRAVRSGKIKKAAACEMCAGHYLIQAHHDNYAKPLDVRWLCVRCHLRLHKEQREAMREAAE